MLIPLIKKPMPEDTLDYNTGMGVSYKGSCATKLIQKHGATCYDNEYFSCDMIRTCDNCVLHIPNINLDTLASNNVITKGYALKLRLESGE